MKLNVAICDDDVKDIDYIRSLIKTYDIEHEVDFHVDAFSYGNQFIKSYKKAGLYDIIFLDVELPDVSGIDIARHIRNIPDNVVKIVFISNYPEYMRESFNVQAFNYLTKPLAYTSFCSLIATLIEQINIGRESIAVIETDDATLAIPVRDILYICTSTKGGRLLEFNTTDGVIIGKGTLAEQAEKLAPYSFIEPHRGFLVNVYHIHYVKPKEIVLDNGENLPVSRRQEKYVKAVFSKKILTVQN